MVKLGDGCTYLWVLPSSEASRYLYFYLDGGLRIATLGDDLLVRRGSCSGRRAVPVAEEKENNA